MNLPLIDVVIPCYNTEQTLFRAVESVLQQNNLGHLWLMDDSSTDNTFALALQHVAQYPKNRAPIAQNRFGGQSALGLRLKCKKRHFVSYMQFCHNDLSC